MPETLVSGFYPKDIGLKNDVQAVLLGRGCCAMEQRDGSLCTRTGFGLYQAKCPLPTMLFGRFYPSGSTVHRPIVPGSNRSKIACQERVKRLARKMKIAPLPNSRFHTEAPKIV